MKQFVFLVATIVFVFNLNAQCFYAGTDFVADEPEYNIGFTLTDNAYSVTAVGTDFVGNAISLWFNTPVDMSGLLSSGGILNYTTGAGHSENSSFSISLFDTSFSGEALLPGYNFSDSYISISPLVNASIDLTAVQNMVINTGGLGNYVNIDVTSFCTGMPTINPPIINLEDEYFLVQNEPFILDASDKVTSEGGTVTYQWYYPNGTLYPDNLGGNTPILNLLGEESNAGLWSLEVTDDGGTTSHYLTLIYKKDTDGDGLSDEDETYIYYTNPNNSDTDEDGLTDFDEVMTYSTDPTSADTDNDGLGDSNEVISFAIINGPFSWEEARMDAISKNGRLAIIDNDEKQNIVESIASQLEDHIMLWIGLSDSQTEGHWKWINGTELNYNNWGPDEPNANANEDYATFSTGGWGMNFGQWMDTLPYGLADDEWDYIIEYTELTDPNDSDSDDDGLSDGDEVNVYSTNPNNLDSDADGLNDGNEVNVYSTNPNSTDSDSDQISDYDEINTHLTDPNLTDSDSDQLSDYSEINLHSTDPNDSDSDDDGLSDGDEVNLYSTDPNNQDTDDDNYLDANDEFPLDVNEWLDTDGDTIGDNADTDDDNDSYLDAADAFPLDASEWLDTDGDTIGNNADTDDDNDTILDYKEIEIGSNPLVSDTLESLVTIIDELILNNSSKLSIDEVKDLRPGSTMIEVSGNQATVQLQMEESSDLQTWEDTGTPATMTIPADTDTKFFRFKMAE